MSYKKYLLIFPLLLSLLTSCKNIKHIADKKFFASKKYQVVRITGKRNARVNILGNNASRTVPYGGSGFVLDKNKGLIVTNHHVVNRTKKLKVHVLHRVYKVQKVLASSKLYDLAVVRIDIDKTVKRKLKEVSICKKVIKPYQKVRFYGYTGERGILNTGSGYTMRRRQIRNVPVFTVRMKVSGGNSGSPVYNQSGKVIGVISSAVRRSKISAFVPIKYLKKLDY